MKLELLLEDGKPIIVFSDHQNHNKTLLVYTFEGHVNASRAYLRSLKKPETAAEQNLCWQFLKNYPNGFPI